MQRRVQRFAEFDPAAGQRIKSLGRRARAPHQQNLAVAKDRGADGKLGTGGLNGGGQGRSRKGACDSWRSGSCPIVARRSNSTQSTCEISVVMMFSTSASVPPLMMPPASATSGLTQPVACSASVARVLSWRGLAHRRADRGQDRGHGRGDIVELGADLGIGRFIGLDREIARLEIGRRRNARQ